jgi:hypothetical protein
MTIESWEIAGDEIKSLENTWMGDQRKEMLETVVVRGGGRS